MRAKNKKRACLLFLIEKLGNYFALGKISEVVFGYLLFVVFV
jgi:hypothetical protein